MADFNISKAVIDSYEMVIGLEVHVELKTNTKIFCGCSTRFGDEPNTNACPICLAMPGALPVLNKRVVEFAIKAGLATNCEIPEYSIEDRKNYFYPDLTKAYQISQGDFPICKNGWLNVETSKGTKKIGITRIHIEEDAGKLIHIDGEGSLVDANRGGVPLIEIVSEPDIRSAEEAKEYLQKLRGLMRYADVSDCKMNEGSFRCDVNLSVRKRGEEKFGVRAEMKNINSFQFAVKAIEYEFLRQVNAIESGELLVQETRKFDQISGKTFSMREKVNAADYRYFPDPDLPPIVISSEYLKSISDAMPVLPEVRKAGYIKDFSLGSYAAEQLTLDRGVADFFDSVAAETDFPVLAANIIINDIIPKFEGDDFEIGLNPAFVAEIAQMLGEEHINSGTARRLAETLFADSRSPAEIVKAEGMEQISDVDLLTEMARRIAGDNLDSIRKFRDGKESALQAIVGAMMRETAGKGNPRIIQQVVRKVAEEI